MSRRIERNFTNPSDISRHLFCSICTEVFRDPTRLFCGHTFCRKCLSHWLKDHHTCPFCRDDVDHQLMSKDQIASSLIQDLEVQCVNSQCPWTDRLEELDNHCRNCNFSQPPEWLTRVKDIIEIDDEQISQKSPEKTEIPPLIIEDLEYQIAQNTMNLNLLHQVFTIKEETDRLIQGMNDLQSISDTLQLNLENRIHELSNSTSDSLIIDWTLTPTPKKKRPHRKVQNNINPNVIKTSRTAPPQTLHQIALKTKRNKETEKRKLKAQQDEEDFFGIKQSQNESDSPVNLAAIRHSSKKKRSQPKTVDNGFESIIKKTKTAAF